MSVVTYDEFQPPEYQRPPMMRLAARRGGIRLPAGMADPR
jgi:hypothetical protein